MEGDFMQYDSGGNFTLGASSSVAPKRLKYAPRRASTRPNEMSISEANGESLSRSTDDSDLEWRKENEISYDDEDSSDLDKYCDESDIEECKLPRPKNENIYENGEIVLRITSVCRAEGCKWRIHASSSPDEREFIIKTYNLDHSCQCVVKNRIATSGWIAKKLSSTLAKTPDMNLQRMRLELKDQFRIEATNRQLWKARQKAREHGGFNYTHSYGNLRRCAAMIYKTNPRSVAIIQSNLVPIEQNLEDENLEVNNLETPIMKPQFNRIFICYSGVKTSFLTACRPFFGLDGCHLKGPYKGILLAAVGLDANLHFYPIAYAVVEAENNSSWKWVLDLLRNEIGDTHRGQPWSIMSDRQKGLIEAVTNIPDARHRFCCFHLENNMVKKFGTSHLQDWLSDIDFKHWTMSKFDPNVKVEHLTNNFIESFNDWIEDHRYKAPIELLEGIRMQQTAMMYARKVTADRWEHKLTPKVHLKELLPPVVKKPPGIPKKHRRRRVAGEERPLPPTSRKQPTRKGVSSTKKCSNCHEFGHNSRSCKKPIPCLPQPLAQPIKDKSKGKKKENTTCQGIGNVEKITQPCEAPSQPEVSSTRGK
uniref:MULE transposase domain-containing protein n=1 Tax=Cannabis sativa TaxID=3483 RepID=A0A803Q0P6_CANSA